MTAHAAPAPAMRPASRRGYSGRFLRDRHGVTALEYALVAVPFTMSLLFLVELAFDFYVQASIDFAVEAAARQVQRGDMPANPQSRSDFASNVLCPFLSGLLSCSNVAITMRTVSDWKNDPNLTPPVRNGAMDPSTTTFCYGGPTQPMLLQAVYPAPTWVMGLFGRSVVNYGSGNLTSRAILIVGSAAFLYEPGTQYGAATCS